MKLGCWHQQHALWRAASFSQSRTLASILKCTTRNSSSSTAELEPDVSSSDEGGKKHHYYQMNFSDLKDQNKVGAFEQLPMVVHADEIVDSSLKRARLVPPTKGISNILKRERNRGAKQLDFLFKALSGPLKTYLTGFPQGWELHPYERSLLELSLGKENYAQIISNVRYLHKTIVNQGKNMTGLCAKATSKKEALQIVEESFTKLEQIFRSNAQYVEDLKDAAKLLRRMPVANPRTPILCLVGAPNVGKSSLVRVLSSGKPEVCDYPFTTRGISMGHIIDGIHSYQVTDTPGLLRRSDNDRNNMEKLTLSALAYLPTAVLYVHDLTGDCGTTVENQFHIYKEMRSRFTNKPWMDVVSKADLLELPPVPEGEVDELDWYRAFGPTGALRVSVETNEGLDELKCIVQAALEGLSLRMKEEGLLMDDDEGKNNEERKKPEAAKNDV